jgi:hypothetical protein
MQATNLEMRGLNRQSLAPYIPQLWGATSIPHTMSASSRRWADWPAPWRSLSPDQVICITDSPLKEENILLHFRYWLNVINYCCLKRKPAIMPKQSCTLLAVLHIAFVELRWLAVSVQGQLTNCRPFERGPSVGHWPIDLCVIRIRQGTSFHSYSLMVLGILDGYGGQFSQVGPWSPQHVHEYILKTNNI